MTKRFSACLLFFAAGVGWAQPVTSSPLSSDDEIRKIITQRVEARQATGIVVGVIDPNGRRIISYGTLAAGDTRPLNGDTVFEIGSITKVFTSLLLADMVRRGEVALNDPVAKYLPEGVKMPERAARAITLLDLSTHTSGLPRLPANMKPKDAENPYADYTVEQMYQFLSSYTLTRDIGSQYEYSNLGGGLLGHVLARRAGQTYEDLVRLRIARPLQMNDTAITLPDAMKQRFAVGHNEKLEPVANWDLPALPGAGALRSTANDLLTFLAAFLGYKDSPLAPAMKAMLETRRPGPGSMQTGLAWLIVSGNGQEIVWHNGGTGGFRSFIGYDPKQRFGVVVLANAETVTGMDDVGMHLLNPRSPLAHPQAPKEHKEISVNPKIFDRYTGRYQLAPNFILVITREGDRIFAQATGQPKVELYAETERDYFLKVTDAQITFEASGDSPAGALVLHQLGRDLRAARIE